MSEGREQAEDPSMEDILASIRRILNDDEVPGAPAPHEAGAVGAGDVFVLDKTMLIEEPPPVATESYPADPPAPEHAPEPDEPLLAPSAAAAASASMGALVRVVDQQQTPVYRGGPTLEDMVRDEVRKLVKSWLDENLAPMVERMVRAEIARVTNGK